MKPKKSSRKPRPAPKRPPAVLAALDQMQGCCENIETLGDLLAACGTSSIGSALEPPTIGHVGHMIRREAQALREMLSGLGLQPTL